MHTSLYRQRAPAAVAVLLNVIHELLILIWRPRPLLQAYVLVAAGSSPHAC